MTGLEQDKIVAEFMIYRKEGHKSVQEASRRAVRKLREEVAKDLGKEEVEKTALAHEAVQRALDGAAPKKVIVVPGRIVNVVV